jgi:hypothetical protein
MNHQPVICPIFHFNIIAVATCLSLALVLVYFVTRQITVVRKFARCISQEEYQVKDCIGTLECGHRYHAECVHQWLLVKNLCPICKTTALSTDQRHGQ